MVTEMLRVNEGPDPVSTVVHIVYAWPYLEWGGTQRYFVTLMRRAVKWARVTAIMPVGSAADLVAEIQRLGVAVELMPGRLIVTRPATFAQRVAAHVRAWHVQYALWRACRRVACPGTVFHCDVPLTLFAGLLRALTTHHAVVVTFHTSLPVPGRWRALAWRWKFGWLTGRPGFRLVAGNRHVRESLRPFLTPAVVAAMPVAYSPVEQTEIADARSGTSQHDMRQQLGVGQGRFLVVTGAQFIERKGCWVMLEAASQVRARTADVDFLWLGPEPLTGRAEAEVHERRHLFRYIQQTALPDGRRSYLSAVAAADAFVLPSLEEGLPLALVEAMALGIPVISTPVNAIPEAVEHGVHGLLVPPGDAAALAEAILHLAGDPALARRLAAAGEAHASIFDAEVTVDVTFAVYKSCVRPA
jgi:glycosyltransferase involved in cell wall biosynthesis